MDLAAGLQGLVLAELPQPTPGATSAIDLAVEPDIPLQYQMEPDLPVPYPPSRRTSFCPPPKHHHRPDSHYIAITRPQSARPDSYPKPWLPSATERPQTARDRLDRFPLKTHLTAVAQSDASRAASPREASALWQPVTAPWTGWSMTNTAYPALAPPPGLAARIEQAQRLTQPGASTPRASARRRYSYQAPSAGSEPRAHLAVPLVRLKHPWLTPGGAGSDSYWRPPEPNAGEGPATAPVPAAGKGPAEGGAPASGVGSGVATVPAAGAGAGLGGLGGLGGLLKKKKLSLKMAARLTRGLSSAQARARAWEAQRMAAEREAHLQSLRSALGADADPVACQLSVAAAIEHSMEEALLRAIPPPREHSPSVVRRNIEKLEREKLAMLQRIQKESAPRSRRPPPKRRDSGSKFTSRPMPVMSVVVTEGGSDADGHDEVTELKTSLTELKTPRPPSTPKLASRPGHVASAAPKPSPPRKGGYPAGAACLPARILADYDSMSLDALPMPLPRSFSRRRRAGAAEPATERVPQSHTIALQEVLVRTGHLLHRPSLLTLVARILEDESLLPLGEEDAAELEQLAEE